MAPPDRSDVPRDTGPLLETGLTEDSRLWRSACRMMSWVEWLLHPEEHDYDRTVIYPNGEKREEPGRVTKANPLPGQYDNPTIDLPFESVIEGYAPWQFVHGMAAVSTQVVEHENSLLGIGAAALNDVYWGGNVGIPSLVDAFQQSGWSGDEDGAATGASTFLLDLQTVAQHVNLVVAELHGVGLKYGVIVKGVRDNLANAADEVARAFQDKFDTKPESGVSIDVVGVVLAGIAASTVTYLTAGATAPIAEGFIAGAWSALFSDAVSDLLKGDDDDKKKINGYWWRDIAQSYMHRQAVIFAEANEAISGLNRKLEELSGAFDTDLIKKFLEDHAS